MNGKWKEIFGISKLYANVAATAVGHSMEIRVVVWQKMEMVNFIARFTVRG